MSDIIKKALDFAEEKHKGQKRLNEEDYINHPKRVADIVKEYKKSSRINELLAAALLHDTLEDTNTGINEIRERFGETIALLVVELTNDEKKKELMGKTRYLATKLSQNSKVSSWGLVIKLADRLDNVRDLISLTDISFKSKYMEETKKILDHLEVKRELTGTHKRLINDIKEIISRISNYSL